MDVSVYSYPHGDPLLIDKIVHEFLSQGKFDKLRKECMSDADTKPAYQNLQQRVESTVAQFLKKQIWKPDLNKNQLRDTLRKHILDSNFFDAGINRIVDQVVNANVLATVFLPEVEEVVYNYLSIPKPADKSQKKVLSNNNEKYNLEPGENDTDTQNFDFKGKDENRKGNSLEMDLLEENRGKILSNKKVSKETAEREEILEPVKMEIADDENIKDSHILKSEDPKIKTEIDNLNLEETSTREIQRNFEKMELPSDESQESISRIGVEKLQIKESEAIHPLESEDSYPMEIYDKSMSESRDSEDSIMNQMSPISQGRLTPDIVEENKIVGETEKEEKGEKEEKRPLTFIGKIPKIKREDSESSKSKKTETLKGDALNAKNVYSSDESDSSKSCEKSDSDDKKSKNKTKSESKHHRDEKSHKDHSDKKRKDDDRSRNFKDRDKDKKKRDDKPRESSSKDRRRERSRDKSRGRSRDRSRYLKKSSSSGSSSSREKSTSHRKNSRGSHQKSSKSRDDSYDKKKKEEEKKKSKNTDDHGRERNRRDDRRSTDRDSNERDKSSGSRSQGETKRRERDHKTEDTKNKKNQKEETEMEKEVETIPETEEVVIEMDGDWMPEGEEIVLINEDWICPEGLIQESEIKPLEGMEIILRKDSSHVPVTDSELTSDFAEFLYSDALTKIEFPVLLDDFYVKFNSTGFKYFEEWEQSKLDCEEEFKEFVDEAENDLALLSDDGSDPESEFDFEEENRKTIYNLLRGIGNYKKGLMFDPNTSEFYKWTNNKLYQKFRKKSEKKWRRNTKKNDSDESVKENINSAVTNCETIDGQKEKNKENQAREKKALHLKLLNRYKRKAIRQGKPRRRHRRKALYEGIKEKNENSNTTLTPKNLSSYQSENERIFNVTEAPFLGPHHTGRVTTSTVTEENVSNKFNFSSVKEIFDTPKSTVDNLETGKPYEENSLGKSIKCLNGDLSQSNESDPGSESPLVITNLPDSPEDFHSLDSQKNKKRIELNLREGKPVIRVSNSREVTIKSNNFAHKCNLPLSPESDDCNPNNGPLSKEIQSKRILKLDMNEPEIPKKKPRRNYSQKYENQDLYKPRPVLNTSRSRGRGDKGSENDSLS